MAGLVGPLLAALLAAAPAGHSEGHTAIAAMGGLRLHYDPKLADEAAGPTLGDPLKSSIAFGPAVLLPFSYWKNESLQYSLELGWAQARHRFRSGRSLETHTFTATVAARWLPWPESSVWPYVGGAIGYFFTTAAFGGQETEDSNAGVGLLAGLGAALGERLSLLAELRGLIAPEAKTPARLGVQPGGVQALVGLSISLEPEPRLGAGN
jgi:hypothetical protein